MELPPPLSAGERLAILRATRTVAIVGMSADPSRASHFVATYLLSSSCSFEHVWFVNPKGGEVLGRPVYPSLAAARNRPTSSTCSAAPTTCRRSPRRSSPSAAPRRSGASSGCSDEAARIAHAAGATS